MACVILFLFFLSLDNFSTRRPASIFKRSAFSKSVLGVVDALIICDLRCSYFNNRQKTQGIFTAITVLSFF